MNRMKQCSHIWYQWIYAINPMVRYFVTIVGIVLIISLWYFLLYHPMKTAVVWYQKNVGLVHKKRLSLVKLHETVATLESKLNAQTAQESMRTETKNSILHPLEDFLLDRLHQHQLQVTEYQKGKTTIKKWFSKTLIFLTCNGSKEACVAFLHDLKKEQAMIEITELTYETTDLKTVRMVMHCYLIDPIIKKSLQPIDKLKGEGV